MDALFEALKYYMETGRAIAYLIAMAAGAVTSFTPCVYPVIPITIGYIGAASAGSRRRSFLLSVAYVTGIAVTYSTLGAIAALTGRIFGQVSTSPLAYFVIANVCLILGMSMLGVFELSVPAFLTGTKTDTRRRGIIPAFFMGLASGLIVGPCTAPVLFVILTHVAARQNIAYGVTILFSFAFGMGFLLILLGTFTGLVLSMPKAGPWLVTVKKFFGFILIAVGEYLLFKAGRLSV